jgi:hypothetical protein
VTLRALPAVDLSRVALGIPTLIGMETLGSTSDGSIVLLKTTFIDSGFPSASGVRSSLHAYSVSLNTYVAEFTGILEQGLSLEAAGVSVRDARFLGTSQLLAIHYVVAASPGGEDQDRIALLSRGLDGDFFVSSESLLSDIIGVSNVSVTLEQIDASIDGRFLVLQTPSPVLIDDGLDTNDTSDVYLVDLSRNNRVTRISEIAGFVPNEKSEVKDVFVRADGTLQVLFGSAAMFTNSGDDGSGESYDLFLWSQSAVEASSGALPSIQLVSRGINSSFDGDHGLISEAGIYFQSQSDDGLVKAYFYSGSGEGTPTVIEGLSPFFSERFHLEELDRRGDALFFTSDRLADGSALSVDQLFKFDTRTESVSLVIPASDGGLLDDIATSSAISASGNLFAFVTQATNLLESSASADSFETAYVMQLEGDPVVTGKVYHWKSGALLSGVEVNESVVTNSAGVYLLEGLGLGVHSVYGSKESLPSGQVGSVITSEDALAALRIALGRSPNVDGSEATPYQFIAADIDRDGKVTSTDALQILKMSLGRADALTPQWVFVDEMEDFWDETLEEFSTSRWGVPRPEDLAISVDPTVRSEVNLVGILQGDVNGSWAAPTGSAALPLSYFQALAGANNTAINIAQFG